MDSMYKLTLLSLTYNHEKFIEQTLESFLMQKTNFSFKILIADDASTDNTPALLKRFAEKYPDKIELVLRDKNMGPAKNWLDMLMRVNTEYLIYCDGDDFFTDPDKLQKQVDFLDKHPDFTICFHPVVVVDEENPDRQYMHPTQSFLAKSPSFTLEELLKHNFIQTNSCVYRWRFNEDEKVENVYPTDMVPGDYFMHLLHAEKGKIGFIGEIMSAYRKHSQSMWHGAEHNADWFIKYGLLHVNFYKAVQGFFSVDQSLNIKTMIQKTMFSVVKLQRYDILAKLHNHNKRLFDDTLMELSQLYANKDKQIQVIHDLEQTIIEQNEVIEKNKRTIERQQHFIESMIVQNVTSAT